LVTLNKIVMIIVYLFRTVIYFWLKLPTYNPNDCAENMCGLHLTELKTG